MINKSNAIQMYHKCSYLIFNYKGINYSKSITFMCLLLKYKNSLWIALFINCIDFGKN